jgi:tRNA (cmo5U34)-methyltransferase
VGQLAARARRLVGPFVMAQYHWDPASYLKLMRQEVPDYERLQAETAVAGAAVEAHSILELGTGTGETARRVLAAHPGARLHGIDSSAQMLAVARDALAAFDVALDVAMLEEPLPPGPFELVVSALAVHHLDGPGKRWLFRRVADALAPGGRFVLADVVVPEDPGDAVTPIDDDGYDKPDRVADQLAWLSAAGLRAAVHWRHRDLAVLVADKALLDTEPV